MAQPPGGGSLADQMAALQKRVDKREKRRASDRRERSLGSDYDGFRSTYDDHPTHNQPKRRAANATGGLPLGSAAAAVAAAGALAGPTLQRCELCAATFGSERELALHLEGAAHRQAVARAEAEAERRRRLGAYADVAASAVQAAVWQSGGSGGRPVQRPPPSSAAATGGNAMALGGSGSGSGAPAPQPQQGGRGGGRGRGGGPQQQQQQGRGRGQPPQSQQPAVHARDLTSHEEMLKQARGGDKAPLDLDGWVPPTVPQAAATAAVPAAAEPQRHQEQAQQTSAGGAKQQPEPGHQLLGGLVSYGEEDVEKGASDQAGGVQEQRQQAQQQEGSSDSDGSSSDSDSDGGDGGGGAPASFFTF